MMSTDNEFQREGLSIFEAAAVAGIGRTKLYEALNTKALVSHRYGKRRIVLRKDLLDFLNALPTE
ncbi:excisionase family DNA binding protein [Bradyrhizobium japonicum]